MPWFYGVVRQTKVWNISIEAEDAVEAHDKLAEVWAESNDEPDYDHVDYEIDGEVKGYVE